MNLLHTHQLSTVIQAKAAAQIDECIREAIALCARECVNVTLVHNEKEYKVVFNELLATVQRPQSRTLMTTPINHPPTRAQRLVDEFQEGASWSGGFDVRRGIAWVLRHIADTEAGYADLESFYAIPARTLEDLADALEAPSLLDRAMAGDADAARQFLHEAGFTDASGNWLPQYQTPQETE